MTVEFEIPVVDGPVPPPRSEPAAAVFRRQVVDAFERGGSPDFSTFDPNEWIEGMDEVMNLGRLEIARYGLQQLCLYKPNLKWAQSMLQLAESMPPEIPGAPTFADDRRSDLQVVPREGAGTVILVFCGRRNQPHMPLPMFQRWIGRLGASVVYLRDFQDDHYLGGVASCGSVDATLERLQRIIGQLRAEQVLCLGNCSGGYAALRYGVALGAERVFAFGSPINMEPEFNAYLNRAKTAQRLAAEFPDAVLDLREVYLHADHRPETALFYGDKCWDDRIHCEHMSGLPGVRLEPVRGYSGHGVVPKLIRREQFDDVLSSFIAPAGAG